jgi:hypothetical protein
MGGFASPLWLILLPCTHLSLYTYCFIKRLTFFCQDFFLLYYNLFTLYFGHEASNANKLELEIMASEMQARLQAMQAKVEERASLGPRKKGKVEPTIRLYESEKLLWIKYNPVSKNSSLYLDYY